MTPEEAARLLGAIDTVIDFDSKDTGLPIRSNVARQLTDRESVNRYMRLELQNDEVASRFKRSSLVLKKFGFIPRDFDLQRFAADAPSQDLAGYYLPRTKTIYLLNWLPTRAQLPVMAHELTHALQDQNFGLESWMKLDSAGDKNLSEVELDEQRSARRAVVEGHATAVMLDYILSPYGKSLQNLPALGDLLQRTRATNSIAMVQAPLILREGAAFPYTYGLVFIHQVLTKAGKERAYSGVFQKPPRCTRQIMEPGTYLSDEKILPLKMPMVESLLGPEYEKLDVGAMGEFEVMVFVKQFGSVDQAKQIAPQWRGGYYFAARRLSKSDVKSGGNPVPGSVAVNGIPNQTDDIALLYVSRWASSDAARAFAEIYRSALVRRYPGAKRVGQESLSSTEEVNRWNTAEGLVLLQVKDDVVVAVESLDDHRALLLLSEALNKALSN